MANEDKRTIEIPTKVTLEFSYRMDKEQDRSQAKTAKVKVDLSGLSAEDFAEWAFSNMVIGYQGKLRSKNPPVPGEDGTYEWKVPARGTRSTMDPAKVEEAADALLKKMTPEMKFHLLVKQGVPEVMARTVAGLPAAEVKK